jgi:hypothetical protein
MISFDVPQKTELGSIINCTTASTFEKTNSLKFELLFGDYLKKTPKADVGDGVINAFDYIFAPDQIFGFAYESFGVDFKKFHHAFVLRTCGPGEIGGVIPGILPGAEILVSTVTAAASSNLRNILQILRASDIKLINLPPSQYRHLNYLLAIRCNIDFFVAEMR